MTLHQLILSKNKNREINRIIIRLVSQKREKARKMFGQGNGEFGLKDFSTDSSVLIYHRSREPQNKRLYYTHSSRSSSSVRHRIRQERKTNECMHFHHDFINFFVCFISRPVRTSGAQKTAKQELTQGSPKGTRMEMR